MMVTDLSIMDIGFLLMTYNELINNLQNYCESTDVKFRSALLVLVNKAERRIYADIDLDVTHVETSLTLAPTSNLVTIPDDCQIIQSIATDNGEYILQKDKSFCDMFDGDGSVVATPRYYNQLNNNTLFFTPKPANSITLAFTYVRALPLLSLTNATSWVSLNEPDLLLNASIIECYKFLRGAKEDLDRAKESYDELLSTLSSRYNLRNRTDEYRDRSVKLG